MQNKQIINDKDSFKYPSYEFYVAANNRDLILHLSEILKRYGYIGYADGGGKMHYVVDGSTGAYKSAGNIMAVLSEAESEFYSNKNLLDYERQKESIELVLAKNKIPRRLKGYTYLFGILLEMLVNEQDKTTPDKAVFSKVAEQYGTGRRQIDRVINYSFKKANIVGTNSGILADLVNEVRTVYREKYFNDLIN